MNAPLSTRQLLPQIDHSHLDWLEEEAIFILRETAAAFERPACCSRWQGFLRRAAARRKGLQRRIGADRSRAPAFPLLHVRTPQLPEVIEFESAAFAEMGAGLVVGHSTIRSQRHGAPRDPSIAQRPSDGRADRGDRGNRFDVLIGGARRDEERRARKERIFSHRDSFGQWLPKEQRPELWTLFNTRIRPGEHMRAFPISNWTELDVWLYIERERIPLPSLYYTHTRDVVRRKGLLVPVTPVTPVRTGESIERVDVRFRTVGDMTCTCPVESDAVDAAEVVAETLQVTISERCATRMDDRTLTPRWSGQEEGYF